MTGPSRPTSLASKGKGSRGSNGRSQPSAASARGVRRGGLATQNPSLKRLALAGSLTRRSNSPFSHARPYSTRSSRSARTCPSPRHPSTDAELEMRSRIESLEEELATMRGSVPTPSRIGPAPGSSRVKVDASPRTPLWSSEEVTVLRKKLEESETRRRELHAEITEIAKSSFGQQGESRAALQRRVAELEEELQRTREELGSEKQRADRMIAELQQRGRGAQESEQRVLLLTEENNRMRAEADTYSAQAMALESRLSFLMPSLTDDDKQQLRQVISGLINNRPAAFATIGSEIHMSSTAGKEGTAGGLTVNSLSRMVDTLRSEKSDLVDEIQSLRKMLQIEDGMSEDMRKLMEANSAESRRRVAELIKERDKWQRLAANRDLQTKQLQKKLVESRKSHIPASISEGRRTAVSVGSDGGFSDLSEIPDLSLNSLDVILSKGTLDEAMIHSMGFPIGRGHSETLMSVVLVSFYDFDLCVSDAAAGLNPNYRTTLSFPGLDMINDNNLWRVLETEGLRLELEAFQVGATAAAGGAVIGTSHISLSDLLQRSEDPNPTITGEAVFAVASPSGDVSEAVGSVRYKLRFRHPIVDHYDQWRLRKATEDLGGGTQADRSAWTNAELWANAEDRQTRPAVQESTGSCSPRSSIQTTPLPPLSSIVPS